MGKVVKLPSRSKVDPELAEILYGADPFREQLRRCVLAVYKKEVGKGSPEGRKTLSRAFAICTRNLQRHGYLYRGSNEPTEKGKRASLKKLQDASVTQKRAEYQEVLADARGPKLNLAGAIARATGKPTLVPRSKSEDSGLGGILKKRLGAANRR